MIETDSKSTSTGEGGYKATVYSTDDSIKVVFSNGDLESSAWISEQIAKELIALLTAVVNGKPEDVVA